MPELTSTALKVAAWLSLLLVVVTLGPIGLRPMSGLSVHIERFGAFAVVGVIFSLAYPRFLVCCSGRPYRYGDFSRSVTAPFSQSSSWSCV